MKILHALSKGQLISIVQDYQDKVSDIESIINAALIAIDTKKLTSKQFKAYILRIRKKL